MPRSLRRRAALAVVLVGAVPLLASSATRADVLAGTPGSQVTFRGGGLLGLGSLICMSEPSRGRLTVPAETTVNFVNYTGQQATLRVDGRDAGVVGPNQAVPVLFHRGAADVTMAATCWLNLDRAYRGITVEVSPATGALPGSGSRTAGPVGASGPTGIAAIGDPKSVPVGKVAVSAPVPAKPVSTGANRLLSLLATVCAMGMSAGAIRAIVAERASRPRFA